MKGRWPITLMCEVLQVSASGYFRWAASTRAIKHGGCLRHSDDALLVYIRAIHEQLRAEYGWPRMHRELLARGLRVGKGVFHTKFGEGVLLTLEGSGADARAQVNFGRHGTKWLALSVAKLTPID